jgi:hypothetical protein
MATSPYTHLGTASGGKAAAEAIDARGHHHQKAEAAQEAYRGLQFTARSAVSFQLSAVSLLVGHYQIV